MKNLKTSLVCICLLFATSGFAQKVILGVGVGGHFGLYTNENSDQILEAGYTTSGGISPAASFLLDYKSTGTFSIRLQPVLTIKQIKFIEEIEGVRRGDSNYLGISFIALDLGVTGRFALPVKKWQLTPFAGLNFSFNKHANSEFNTQSNSSGSSLIIEEISQGNSFAPTELFIKPGLIVGMGIGSVNSKLELEAKIVYTPLDYVKGDTMIPFSDDLTLPFIGSFQYFGLGLNYKFI